MDKAHPFTNQMYLAKTNSAETANNKLHTADTASEAVTVYFSEYFLQKIPFTICPAPYEKKKNVLTNPACA